ncbi:MAG: DUF2786 domain-containing protein [Micromonosporaceae bacterium]|nr:DUF2786 domain-containing protein [Micromonosporaceae bacterium]
MTDTDQNRQKILAKITACLALAEHGATPAERETAAAKAAALMARHNIDQAQARASRGEQPEELTIFPFAVSGDDGHGRARASLAIKVAEAMGCRGIHKPAPAGRPYTAIITGPTSDVHSLRLLLPLIVAQAHYAAAHHGTPAERRRRTYLPSFLLGYGATVAQRITARRRPLFDETTNPGTALILADRASRLDALIAERFGTLTDLARPRVRDDAIAAGVIAGRSADLGDPGMNATADRPALTG